MKKVGVKMSALRVPVMVVMAAFLTSEIIAQGSACHDDFSTSNIGPGKAWTFLDRDNATGGAAQIANEKLELSGKGEDIYRDKNRFVAVYRSDIKGDFDVSVKIISQTNTNAWAQAGIFIANNAEDLKQGGYFVVDISPGNALNAFYDAKDTIGWLDSRVGNIGMTAYPMWLRVKKASQKFSAWYSTDGETWKVIAENVSSQVTQSNSQIALFSVSHDTTKAATTVFDDFVCLHEPTTAISVGPGGKGKAGSRALPAVDAAGRILLPGNESQGTAPAKAGYRLKGR